MNEELIPNHGEEADSITSAYLYLCGVLGSANLPGVPQSKKVFES
jgi:hypothetical protein